MKQAVTILGSTGSIGESTLDVIARNQDRFSIHALTAHNNFERLAEQCSTHDAKFAVISNSAYTGALQDALSQRGSKAQILAGLEGLIEVASSPQTDLVMAAIVGAAGLGPSLAAAKAGKKILLANKEALVIAGSLFIRAASKAGAKILPVDSEHNAIFQSLPADFDHGLKAAGVERIILTASGGPFLNTALEDMKGITPEQACKHPNWDMGRKISVDSATLMNKGLELIEAHWLFSATAEQLEVLVHPQSIIHSMVAYCDGSVLAQLGTPDMRTPIAHALAWPDRIEAGVKRLNLAEIGDLSFHPPDLQRFPCLGLAFEAMQQGASAPITLNAANEIAVQSFLDGQIRFDQIAVLVGDVLERSKLSEVHSIDDVLAVDEAARAYSKETLQELQ
jgi:1-deoxy-D-xylulose-5-phosphate reductoisomerase